MIYIVDIDETICYYNYDSDGKRKYEEALPNTKRIERINKLYDEGNTIIYWTARGSSSGIDWSDLTIKQLKSWGCKYHEARLGKPSYDVWIDDKAFNDKDFFKDIDDDTQCLFFQPGCRSL